MAFRPAESDEKWQRLYRWAEAGAPLEFIPWMCLASGTLEEPTSGNGDLAEQEYVAPTTRSDTCGDGIDSSVLAAGLDGVGRPVHADSGTGALF
jgi:hypothetical protein